MPPMPPPGMPPPPTGLSSGASLTAGSERLEILDEIRLLTGREPHSELLVVMIDDVDQGREAAIVVETAFLAGPEAAQRRGSVADERLPVDHRGGSPAGLEIVDA